MRENYYYYYYYYYYYDYDYYIYVRALGIDAREVVQVMIDPHPRLVDAPG